MLAFQLIDNRRSIAQTTFIMYNFLSFISLRMEITKKSPGTYNNDSIEDTRKMI